MATQIVKKIDKHLDQLDIAMWPWATRRRGLEPLKDARRLWATARKAEVVEEAVKRAKLNTAVTGTGGNYDNVLRQQFRNILNSPKKRRGFSSEELGAMRKVAMGTATQRRSAASWAAVADDGRSELSLHGGALFGTGGPVCRGVGRVALGCQGGG